MADGYSELMSVTERAALWGDFIDMGDAVIAALDLQVYAYHAGDDEPGKPPTLETRVTLSAEQRWAQP